MSQDQAQGGRHIQREIDAERQMDLWTAFVDCYSSTSTRAEVNKFLFGLFGARSQ